MGTLGSPLSPSETKPATAGSPRPLTSVREWRTGIRLASVSRIFFTPFLHLSRTDRPRGFNFKNSSAGSVREIQPRPDHHLVIMRRVGDRVIHPDVRRLGIEI